MLKSAHRQEWLDSGVDPEIIILNVESCSGSQPYERLLYSDQLTRRNTGRLSDGLLKRYDHIENGGWWCSGIDVLSGDRSNRSLWGCFKPDTPYCPKNGFGIEGKNKYIKYEHPPKVATEIFALRVPLHVWKTVSQRYDVPMPDHVVVDADGEALGFWGWVIDNLKIPVIYTEGAKKAASLLSAGYVAIGLPGITGGYRTPKDNYGEVIGRRHLIPQIKVFAKEGRESYFCFDQDNKQRTRRNVNHCIEATAKLFTKEGCQSKVITWKSELGKGVDDVIFNHGSEFFNSLYDLADTLEYWQVKQFQQITYPIDLEINSRFVEGFLPPQDANLIGLQSPKKTGKTTYLADIIPSHTADGGRVLFLTHRVQLGLALSADFGIPYITEIDETDERDLFGYGLCVDSLHADSQAQFNPKHWEGAWLIIDEVEQVIWHLLNSPTCKSNRVKILKALQEVIQVILSTGGKIFLSDADLSDTAIDYVQKLAGFKVKPWIVVNNYKFKEDEKWDIYKFDGKDPSSIVAALETYIKDGGKPFICLSGQKKKSQWGTQNLESYFGKKFPNEKILRIDSETIADPNHPAFACTKTDKKKKTKIKKLDRLLSSYDIVIASPTIETGISINCKHFTSVWGIFQGVQTPDSCRQALSRIRDSVPRYVWARSTGFNGIAGGSTSVKSILFSQHKLAQTNINLLRKADFNDEIDTDFQSPSLLTWAKKAAVINLGMKSYAKSIFQGLQEEGHFIIDVANDKEKAEITKAEIKANKEVEYQAHCEAVANVESPTIDEFKKLKERQSKIEIERLKFEKGSIEELYKIPVTPELVKKNDDKWYSKLRLHYYLSKGAIYLSDRDTNIMRKMLEVGEGSVFKPDLNSSLLGVKIATLKFLDFNKFFDKREFSGNDLDVQEIAEECKKDAFNIKSILGITINQKDSPMAILQQLVGLIGYRFPFLRQERNREDQRIRVYGCPAADFERDSEGAILKDEQGQAIPLSDGRDEVFAAWLAHDEAKAAALADAQAAIKRTQGAVSTLGTGVIKEDLSIIGGVPNEVVSQSDLGTGVIKEDLSITRGVPNEVVSQSDLGTGVIKEDLSIIGGVPTGSLEESSEDDSDLVKLVNFLALVESLEQFTVAVEGQLPEAVEDAIALQNTQPKRNQLKEWWNQQRQLPTVEFIEEVLPLQQELTETKPLSLDKHVEPEEPGANLNLQEFKVSSRAYWSYCPAHCQQFAPFEITEINGNYAKLDLFPKPVLLAELELVPS